MARVNVKGVDSVTRRFNNIANMDLKAAISKATQLVHGQAKALAPANDGLLRESIHMSVKDTGKAIQGQVYTNLEYAPYVEFGTGVKGDGTYPYKIKGLTLKYADSAWYIPANKISAKTAERYKFAKVYGKDGAEYYLCYGQKAQPYMYPALKENEKIIKQILRSGVKTKLKENSQGGQ